MNEPYVKTSVVDQTSGITSVTSSNGLQIGCPINSVTGPTERITLNTLNDLVKYFMPGSSFSSSDDITIQHIGALLGSSPVDVIRVDSSTIREGIGSDGSKIYFDTDYNLLDEYTNFNIYAANGSLKPSVIYVAVQTSDSTTIVLAAGDITAIPSPYNAYTIINVSECSYDVNTGVDIDKFFRGIQGSLAASLGSDIEYYSGLISNTANNAIFNLKVVSVGNNLFNVNLNQYGNQLTYTRLPVSNGGIEYALTTGTSMSVGGYTLYLNTGIESTSNITNPVPVPSTSIGAGNAIPATVWYGLVANELAESTVIQDPTGYAAVNVLAYRSGTFALHGSIADYVQFGMYNELANSEIVFPGTIANISNYYITLTYSGTAYNFGDAEGLANVSGNNYVLTATTLPGIYGQLYLALSQDTTLGANIVIDNDNDNVQYNWLYYFEDVKPAINTTLISTDGEISASSGNSTGTDVYHLTTADNATAFEYDGLWILIDGNLFYTGTVTDGPAASAINTSINMGSGTYNIDTFVKLLYENLDTVFDTYGYGNSGFIIDGDYTDSYSAHSAFSGSIRLVNQAVYPDKFAVIAAFPVTTKLFKYSYLKDTSKEGLYQLALNYKGDNWEYGISFDPEAVDGYGNSQYYEALINSNGDVNVFFRVAELAGDTTRDSYTSPLFGNSINRIEPKASDYVIALDKFGEYDNKHYNYFWDAGYASPILAAAGVRLSNNVNAEFVPSFPVTYKRKDQFSAYRNSTGINDPRAYFLAPAQKQAVLGNFNSTLAGSLTFLRSRINLYNTGASEFAPSFGPNYGGVTVGSLVTTFGKSTREELLDYQINTISIGTTGANINFNLTAQSANSYLSEEQFMYLSNVICHIADDYGESLIGYPNDTATRMKVVTELTDRLNQRINSNKSPTASAFKVICNDELNPTSVVESRQIKYEVWVQYTPTIAYVLAATVIKRLGSF